MKLFAIFFYLLALCLGSFGYWGIFTTAGRQKYDEIAGLIPGIALLIAAVLLLVAIILSVILLVRYLKAKQTT